MDRVLRSPRHPYTLGLLRSIPTLELRPGRLPAIPGTVPHPARLPDHCRFHDRCAYRIERCGREDPLPRPVGERHAVACFVDLEEVP